MEGRTHALGGLLAGACLALAWPGPPDPGAALAMAAASLAGSLAPDADHPESALGRRLPLLSHALSAALGHRGALHSAAAAAAFGVLAATAAWAAEFRLLPLLGVPEGALPGPQAAGLAAFCGYLSHLLLDALNPAGVPLFWPLRAGRIGLPLAETSGPAERWAVVPALLAGLAAAGWALAGGQSPGGAGWTGDALRFLKTALGEYLRELGGTISRVLARLLAHP